MAFLFDDDPFNEIFFKYIGVPVLVIMLIGYIFDSFFTEEVDYGNYEWETYEDRYKRDQEKEREWARKQGLEWKLDSLKNLTPMPDYSSENWVDDLENAEPKSSLFREYMEELDDRGVDPGSPRAVEIWDTYYK